MRDPRLAEMQFLAALEANDPPKNFQRPSESGGPQDMFGLTVEAYTHMVVYLIWNGYIGNPRVMMEASDYERQYHLSPDPLAPGPDIELKEREFRRELLEHFTRRQQPSFKLRHPGRVRLWELRDQLEAARDIDPLTGLFRREAFSIDFEIAWNFTQSPVSVLVCDLDHFKDVNTELQYEGGDRALKEFATILTAKTRGIGTAYRWGGDEFVALLPKREAAAAAGAAEDLRAEVEKHFKGALPFSKMKKPPTTTIAHATCGQRVEPEAAFKRAADVLQTAKKATKRNQAHQA